MYRSRAQSGESGKGRRRRGREAGPPDLDNSPSPIPHEGGRCHPSFSSCLICVFVFFLSVNGFFVRQMRAERMWWPREFALRVQSSNHIIFRHKFNFWNGVSVCAVVPAPSHPANLREKIVARTRVERTKRQGITSYAKISKYIRTQQGEGPRTWIMLYFLLAFVPFQ